MNNIQGFAESGPKPKNTPWVGIIVAFVVFVVIPIVFVILAKVRVWPFTSDCDKDPSPCLNGATCKDEWWDGYKCTCTEDWEGTKCETASTKGISKRPCHNEPCYHDAKCTDIDENADGIFEDYECGVDGECPEIKGRPDSLKWKGKNCNTFPDDIDVDNYDTYCFKDVDKTEQQKEYLKQCEKEDKCSDPNKMMMNCKHNCNDSLTHKWCKDNNTCVDRFNGDDVRECDSLWRDKREEHGRHEDNRKKCEEDPSAKWDYHEHVCSCRYGLKELCEQHKDDCEKAECCISGGTSGSETCENNPDYRGDHYLYGGNDYDVDSHNENHYKRCIEIFRRRENMSRREAERECEEHRNI